MSPETVYVFGWRLWYPNVVVIFHRRRGHKTFCGYSATRMTMIPMLRTHADRIGQPCKRCWPVRHSPEAQARIDDWEKRTAELGR